MSTPPVTLRVRWVLGEKAVQVRRRIPYAALTFAATSHLSGRDAPGLSLRESETKQSRHGVPGEGFPRQTRFPQTGGPKNDVGRPGEIHDAAVDRLRSLRDSLVSGSQGFSSWSQGMCCTVNDSLFFSYHENYFSFALYWQSILIEIFIQISQPTLSCRKVMHVQIHVTTGLQWFFFIYSCSTFSNVLACVDHS